MNAHFDVAAYALGVLDERDSDRFEEHLAACEPCAVELESMMPVVDLLAEVDAPSLVATERSRKDGLVLQQMITTVGRERKRKRSRQLLSLAAAAILLVAITGGALVAGGRWLPASNGGNNGGNNIAEGASPRPGASTDGWSPIAPQSGIGGTLPGGEQLSRTDPRTGVRADIGVGKMAWGTQLSFALSNVTGPRVCRMQVVRTNGEKETISSWKVPEKGYGTAKNSQPLMLQAATALPREDIAHVQVQEVNPDGTFTTLVTVPD